jgi:hypothetical protein
MISLPQCFTANIDLHANRSEAASLARHADEDEWRLVGQGLLDEYSHGTAGIPWYDLTPVLRALAMPGDLASGPASPTRGVAVRETQQLAQALVLEVMPGVKVRMHPYMSEASGDLEDLVRTTQDTILRVGVTKTTSEMKDGRRQGEMTMLSRLQGYLHGARPLVSGELWLDLWVSVVPHGQNCEEDLLKALLCTQGNVQMSSNYGTGKALGYVFTTPAADAALALEVMGNFKCGKWWEGPLQPLAQIYTSAVAIDSTLGCRHMATHVQAAQALAQQRADEDSDEQDERQRATSPMLRLLTVEPRVLPSMAALTGASFVRGLLVFRVKP